MNFTSAPDRHRWLSSNSMMVAAKLATSFKPNWKISKLGDIAEKISTGATPPSQERRYYGGNINWFTPADIGGTRLLSVAKKSITNEAVTEKKARIFDSGTILITCIGHIGRVGILSKASSANQQITGIKFNSTINPEFAYYGLFARQDELQAAAPTASTLPILNQSRLSNIDFCFPSLDEQNQISKFLSWYEDRLVSRQPFTNDYPNLPDYLSDLPQIVKRVEGISARIAKAQSLRDEASTEAKSLLNSTLSKITKDLLVSHEPQLLEELTLFIGDMNHDMPMGQENGIPFISPKDFAPNSKIDFEHAKKITREDFERLSKKACPQKGDILMARYGTIGAARYIDTDREFLASYSIAVIRPNPDLVDGRFLYWMAISPYVQEQAIKGIRGSGMADLGLRTIRQFIIPHLNFDEQRRIVAYLDSVQARLASLRELQSATGEELSALLPSVLDRAFKGEL